MVRAQSIGSLYTASALYVLLTLVPLTPAQAGETITYPGNGVLSDVTIGEDIYTGSLAPSASSPSGNTVTVSGGSIVNSVFGGFSDGADVTNNKVSMSGGSIGGTEVASGIVFGGISYSGNAVGNSVTVSGCSIGGTGDASGIVFGGISYSGNAEGNSVTVSGGNIGGAGDYSGRIYGGFSAGNAEGNSVTINSGSIGGAGLSSGWVFGGSSANGNAVGNNVTISGGSIGMGDYSGQIYGGHSASGNAEGNSVTISGGSIGGAGLSSGIVCGGLSDTSNAIGNTVSILGSPVFGPSAQLFGGFSNSYGDARTGNTLNVFTSGITVSTIYNFQHYTFALPTDRRTVLTLTDAGGADLTDKLAGSRIAVPYALPGNALHEGQSVTLLQSAGKLTNVPAAWNEQTGQSQQGVSLLYDYSLSTDTKSISATITNVQVVPESKALAESRAASLSFANLGADLIANAGLANARAATTGLSGGKGDEWGLIPFFALSASNMRYNTGSHTDVQGVALLTGLAEKWEFSAADVLAGVFFEAAFGDYKAHNSSGSASVNGKGDTETVGGGILARVDMTDTALKGLYAEASLRIGSLSSDYRSNDLRDVAGHTAAYDITSTYYGAHAGLGYIWNFNDSASLDVYGKYFWTHQTGQDVTILGDKFSFKDSDSQRVKLGGRFSYAVTETFVSYFGAAWEYEFGGKARATTYGYDVPAPSLKGSTGVGEIGINWKPEKAQGFSVDLGIQGYTGMREGVSGTLQLKYEF